MSQSVSEIHHCYQYSQHKTDFAFFFILTFPTLLSFQLLVSLSPFILHILLYPLTPFQISIQIAGEVLPCSERLFLSPTFPCYTKLLLFQKWQIPRSFYYVLEHRWQTQCPRADSGPPPCFIPPDTLPPSGSTELSLNH